MTQSIDTMLARLLGPRGFTTDADTVTPWLTDWRGRYHGAARAMLSPADTSELAETVRLCAAHQIALVPQGGNTGMAAGATPDSKGDAMLLSLRRLDTIDTSRIADGFVECGAGVILERLHTVLADQGARFPLSLGAKGSATIGGLVATNAGGTQVLRHGNMRALVAGIEAVMADGTVLDERAPLKKDNRGYALRDLIVGSEGTLAIVSRVVLRTSPAIIDRATAWVGVASADAAYRLLRALDGQREQLEQFEIIPDLALESVLGHVAGTRAPLAGRHAWHVIVELVRERPDQREPREQLENALAKSIEAGLVENAAIASSGREEAEFWRIRESISETERAHGPALQHDVSVPVADMPRFIAETSARVEDQFPGTTALAFGHLGDGNVHFHVRAPEDAVAERWHDECGEAISDMVYDMVDSFAGSISAEHGIGRAKLRDLSRHASPARLASLTAIKRALDPHNILNPGALIPAEGSNT
ncbi:FAD-binding oxidoreductase [Sphingorhabdus soli]|uniref:FAD-binding oxidoreductase n=1 Tax=Flavisphingopyxis soli TaxID=2601267 RepID=A0A5C6UNT6_9SPHN|nr:FAD-binding oxidoreductase [Sphingorhabdus soli]TXC74234.1 FAD-binding oxidoreductase [Sphingorhabdus soli]